MLKKINEYVIRLLNLPELIFVIIAFVFGNIFLFITPPGCVPDEPCHVYRSCDVANGYLLSEKRPDFKPYDETLSKAMSTRFKHDDMHYAMRYSPVMYFASALGIKIGHFLSDDELFVFYLGRLFNLLLYIILITFAIRITPVFKYPFMFSALLPMALFQGMSYSADSFGISFTFLFFAYLFKLMFSKKDINKKQLFELGIISIFGALAKGLIYPMFLFFFIPIKKYKFKIISMLMLITIISFIFASSKLNYINLNHTCSVINDKFYIFNEPVQTVKSILLTTKELGYIYIRQLIGFLGWLSIPIPESVCNRVILIFLLMFFVLYEKIEKNIKIFSAIILMFFYFLILYVELITWTPIGKIIIEGVQGRYFIPLLPLLFLAIPTVKLDLSEKYKYLFKIFLVFFIINVLYKAVICLDVYYHQLNINVFM